MISMPQPLSTALFEANPLSRYLPLLQMSRNIASPSQIFAENLLWKPGRVMAFRGALGSLRFRRLTHEEHR